MVAFDDEITAFDMRAALLKMQKEFLIEMEDAVVVIRDQKGKTKLDQVVNLTPTGAVGGGFWGMLIGLILGGLIFLLFVISQFNAFFTYTTLATLAAVKMGDALENAGLGALPLLLGFVIVVAVLDLIMTGAIPKWAIFAPIVVPLLMRLNVEPEAVLAAYRVGDSPMNAARR